MRFIKKIKNNNRAVLINLNSNSLKSSKKVIENAKRVKPKIIKVFLKVISD
tara:strand:+ start:930 stop:1082 length:153 start_codon:yes stop_codon:yes gene_type:complete